VPVAVSTVVPNKGFKRGDSIAKEVDKRARDLSIKAGVEGLRVVWGSGRGAFVIPERSKPYISILGIG
jgi:hypothetical protein